MRRQVGFTLVELVMVMVLAGVLLALAASRFASTQDYSERGFFEEMVSALRYAQKIALASGCPVQVNINVGGYALLQQNANCLINPAAPFTQPVLSPVSGLAFAGAPPAGVTVATSAATYTLGADGAYNGGANVVVTVGTEAPQTLTVIAGSGYVQTP